MIEGLYYTVIFDTSYFLLHTNYVAVVKWKS